MSVPAGDGNVANLFYSVGHDLGRFWPFSFSLLFEKNTDIHAGINERFAAGN
jgi:hypothetical protein